MKAGTSLVSGLEAAPALAAAAVRNALARAGLDQAAGVVLFLSGEFSRHPQPAVLAAARQAGCLQVFGMVANGLFTESGWSLDQPAAAALVVGDGAALRLPVGEAGTRMALAGTATLPAEWQQGPPRHGLVNAGAGVWQHSRLAESARCEAEFTGVRCAAALSTGLQLLGDEQVVDAVHAYDVARIGGLSAQDSLRRALPPHLRERSELPLHRVSAVAADGRPIPFLAANADGSLTFALPVAAGEPIRWALRQPLAAEIDMRTSLEPLAAACPNPEFALVFSCIGRGPLFYGNDDLDLLACRQRFPGLPLLGAYGSGQIVAREGRNCQYQNSVVTLLFAPSP